MDTILFVFQSCSLAGNYVCSDYEIPPVGDTNGIFLQILSAVVLRIQFGSAVFKPIFLDSDYFSSEILIGARFMNCHSYLISCVDRRVECTRGKTPLLGSAPNEPTEKRLESTEDNYSGPTAAIPNKAEGLLSQHHAPYGCLV